jgi:hypothetical protein
LKFEVLNSKEISRLEIINPNFKTSKYYFSMSNLHGA